MKCEECLEYFCKGKYERRNRCVRSDVEGFACNCRCQVTAKKLYLAYGLSVGAGGALIAIGYLVREGGSLTMNSAALSLGGMNLIITPFQKYYASEHLTWKYSVTEVVAATITGAVAFHATNGAQEINAKALYYYAAFFARAGLSGAVGGIVREAARYVNHETVDSSSVTKSVVEGTLYGLLIAVPVQIKNYWQLAAEKTKYAIELSKFAAEQSKIAAEQSKLAKLAVEEAKRANGEAAVGKVLLAACAVFEVIRIFFF